MSIIKTSAVSAVFLALLGGTAFGQHSTDVWVGRDAGGKLALGGIDRSVPVTLSPVSGLITGWSGINPGFDSIRDPATGESLYPLAAGSRILLEIREMSPGMALIDEESHVHGASEPPHLHLGDEHLHTHFTWFINPGSAEFDPVQTLWKVSMVLTDEAGLQQPSEQFSLMFRNVDCLQGDLNGDGAVTGADLVLFYPVLRNPEAAAPARRGAADADLDGFVTEADECPLLALTGEAPFIRSDANSDLAVNLSDPIHVLEYLFSGGPPPRTAAAADANADGAIDVSDPIYILDYLFLGGRAPTAPFPSPACN
jgi:hypothetical protein